MKLGSALTTTLAHPDHFDPSKFKANGHRVGSLGGKIGKPRQVKEAARAEIFQHMVEIRRRKAAIERLLDEAGLKAARASRQVQLKRIWREKGK